MKHLSSARLLTASAAVLLTACGGSGTSGVTGTPPGGLPGPEFTSTLAERQAFASGVLDDQAAILASGAADPADLPASASYSGNWAMSLDPGGDIEIIGGSAALQADFASGTLSGTLQQEILAGADGALSVQGGQISGATMGGTVAGVLGGGDGIGVDTALDGFFTRDGVQGTMVGSATRGGEVVSATGAVAAGLD